MFKLAFWQICSDCTDCCKDTPSCKQAAAEVAITNLARSSLVFYKLSDQLHDSPLTDRAQSEIVKDEIPRSPAQPYRPSVSKVKALLILQSWSLFHKVSRIKGDPISDVRVWANIQSWNWRNPIFLSPWNISDETWAEMRRLPAATQLDSVHRGGATNCKVQINIFRLRQIHLTPKICNRIF